MLLVLDSGAPLDSPRLVAISFGLTFLAAALFQSRALFRAFQRGFDGPHFETSEPEERLQATLQRLAAQVGVGRLRWVVLDTERPISFTDRDGNGGPTVAVSAGILDSLDADERRAVLDHEIAHLRNRDVAVMRWATLPLAAADEM